MSVNRVALVAVNTCQSEQTVTREGWTAIAVKQLGRYLLTDFCGEAGPVETLLTARVTMEGGNGWFETELNLTEQSHATY
jgi:hypothetical protein